MHGRFMSSFQGDKGKSEYPSCTCCFLSNFNSQSWLWYLFRWHILLPFRTNEVSHLKCMFNSMNMLVVQSFLTCCNPLDYSSSGSCVHRIFRARYWSGLPFPSPGKLLNPGTELRYPVMQVDSLASEPPLFGYIEQYKSNAPLDELNND